MNWQTAHEKRVVFVEIEFRRRGTVLLHRLQDLGDASGAPYEVPEGTYLVEKSDVSGMPTDQFLRSIAGVCGLKLKYERNKLVFQKPEKKTPSSQPSKGTR